MRHSEHGFTLVELVVIIVILGVIAVVAGSRFMARDGFDSRGSYDEATAIVRFAQKTAVAWRRPVYVCVAATQVTASAAPGCATPLTNPVTGGLAQRNILGATLNAVAFNFDGLGQANANVVITFTSTVAGDPARQIAVTAATGYIAAN